MSEPLLPGIDQRATPPGIILGTAGIPVSGLKRSTLVLKDASPPGHLPRFLGGKSRQPPLLETHRHTTGLVYDCKTFAASRLELLVETN